MEQDTIKVTQRNVQQGFSEGVMRLVCPKGHHVGAEPDARDVYCEKCGRSYKVYNPY